MSKTTIRIVIARRDGQAMGQYLLGEGEHLIGREESCPIFLDDTHVSREHARLIISSDMIEVEDLNSTSGTYLDGVMLRGRVPIQLGQKLHISDLYIDIEHLGFDRLVKGARLGDGRFTLIREVGKGGMGVVWLALDEEEEEELALKLIPTELSSDRDNLRDLQREVNRCHKINHPNIVRIGYFWQKQSEPAFITLEFVNGTNLDLLKRGSPNGILQWDDIENYMMQLCNALEYAHSMEIAHRDIKPANMMIDHHNNLKLADFGLAASLSASASTLTINIQKAGTPHFMSPQQVEGKTPKKTDDIYSVGATFYDLLTGRPPFYQGEILHQVSNVSPIPLKSRLREFGLQNEIPTHVGAIVMACLNKDESKRPQSLQIIRECIENGKMPPNSYKKLPPADIRHGHRPDSSAGLSYAKGKQEPAPEKDVTSKFLQNPFLADGRKTWPLGIASAKKVIGKMAKAFQRKPRQKKGFSNVMASAEGSCALLWEYNVGDLVWSSPAIGHEGDVYVGSYGNKMISLNAESGVKQWEFITEDYVHSSPAVGRDGNIYFGSRDEKIYALSGKTGEKKWSLATGHEVQSSPAIGPGGTVYIGSRNKNVLALNEVSGVVQWQFKTGQIVDSSPAINADGTIYVSSFDKKVYALDGMTGIKIWEFETGGEIISSPAIGLHGNVYVGAFDNRLYALDAETGKLNWEFETGGKVISSVAISPENTVIFGSYDGNVYALDEISGVKVWEFPAGDEVYSSPAIGANGTVYIGSTDYRLYALDCLTGCKLWEFLTEGEIYSSPVIDKYGTVYFGSLDSKVYAIKTDHNGPAKSNWPMFCQNAQRTGYVIAKQRDHH